MAAITIDSVFKAMAEEKLNPTTELRLLIGTDQISPKQAELKASRDGSVLFVSVSTEWLDKLVASRMKEMFSTQVDCMFSPPAKVTDAK